MHLYAISEDLYGFRFGVAVIVVLAITVPVNNLIFNLFLRERVGPGGVPQCGSELSGTAFLHRCHRRHGADFEMVLDRCPGSVQRLGRIRAADYRELRYLGPR